MQIREMGRQGREVTLSATAAEGTRATRSPWAAVPSRLHFEGRTPRPCRAAWPCDPRPPDDWSPLLNEAWAKPWTIRGLGPRRESLALICRVDALTRLLKAKLIRLPAVCRARCCKPPACPGGWTIRPGSTMCSLCNGRRRQGSGCSWRLRGQKLSHPRRGRLANNLVIPRPHGCQHKQLIILIRHGPAARPHLARPDDGAGLRHRAAIPSWNACDWRRCRATSDAGHTGHPGENWKSGPR
jgi:hypothetical protein